MENEITQIRQQVEQLKLAIASLTEKVDMLSTTNNLDVANSNKQKYSVLSYDFLADMLKSSFPSYAKEMVGVKSSLYSYENIEDGIKLSLISYFLKYIGVKPGLYSYEQNKEGDKFLLKPVSAKEVGIKYINETKAETENKPKLLDKWDVDSRLRKYMPTASVDGLRNTTNILLQLSANKKNSYKDLRNLTGLSEDGMAKRIMAMKKAGLIVRTGFQQYALTAKALECIYE